MGDESRVNENLREQFWDVIEAKFVCSVPIYLKNVLCYSGFDNVHSFKTITENDFQYLENFVKNDLNIFVNENVELFPNKFDIYHIYGPDTFQIPKGHKVLLLEIVKYVIDNFEKYGSNFFCPMKMSNKRGSEVVSKVVQNIGRKRVKTFNPGSESTVNLPSELNPTDISPTNMLKCLVAAAERNGSRSKSGYRFEDIIKIFAAYIKMLSGPLSYETLHANLPLSLPSISTVNLFVRDKGAKIVEGKLRSDELLEYLESRNLPLVVSLAEDATRITAKISYDPSTNQLVGYALPLDINGMPIPFTFKARNAKEIEKHFLDSSNFISSAVYMQMAQPLDKNTSPFCLIMFLIDNKFKALDILNRWKFTKKCLNEKGIKINNYSGDGDSRLLKAMVIMSQLGVTDLFFMNCKWYSCGGYCTTTCTQDPTHVILKWRNRVLKTSRILPFGQRLISNSHLRYLIENVSKDKHLLTPYDIEPKDRQNFQSAEKICSSKAIQSLLKYVPGSEATALFLKAMNYFRSASFDTTIKSAERIYKIWYALFFFRIWRSWIINSQNSRKKSKKSMNASTSKAKEYSEDYSLKENFISHNSYVCIELNAHSLVKKVLKEDTAVSSSEECISNEVNKSFFPNLYGSQTCESTYRQLRSLSTTFSTVVNFNMLDVIHRIKKLQLLSDIVNDSSDKIKFPRFEKKKNAEPECSVEFLSKDKIILEIERAKNDVTSEADKLGIDIMLIDFCCPIKPQNKAEFDQGEATDELDENEYSDEEEQIENDQHEGINDNDEDLQAELQTDIHQLSNMTGELCMRDYSRSKIRLNENDPFAIVADSKGKEIVVRKSSICWLLSKNKFKLSSDRLQRVQEKEFASSIINHVTSRQSESTLADEAYTYQVKNEIYVGDWCIFLIVKEMVKKEKTEDAGIAIGLVLGFTYLEGKTFKEREYSKSSALVKYNETTSRTKDVGVLCAFYNFDNDGILTTSFGPTPKHSHIKINSYIGTIANPVYSNTVLTIPGELVISLKTIKDSLLDEQFAGGPNIDNLMRVSDNIEKQN